MAVPTIKSTRTVDDGCPCGRPFPLRVYLAAENAPTDLRAVVFLITCRCGRTYPLPVEGMGVPPLGGET
jgi:hypothetical protein